MTKSMLQLAMLIGVITAVLGFTTDVSAECGGNFCTGRIDRLVVEHASNGVVWVDPEQDLKDLSCVPDGGELIQLNPNRPLFREIYDGLRNSLIYGRTVTLRISTDSAPCRIAYVILHRTSTSAAAEAAAAAAEPAAEGAKGEK